uniref:Uncharacterized protein n=1 Tax=Magallana gigas TaxID=29159 RepID=K1RKV5_MAGGI
MSEVMCAACTKPNGFSRSIPEESARSTKESCQVYVASGPKLNEQPEPKLSPQILVLVSNDLVEISQINKETHETFGRKKIQEKCLKEGFQQLVGVVFKEDRGLTACEKTYSEFVRVIQVSEFYSKIYLRFV